MPGMMERLSLGMGRAVGAFRYGVADVMHRGIGQDAALARSNRWWQPQGIPAAGAAPQDEARYSSSDDVYAAVSLLAENAATIPWQVTVNGEVAEDHDLLALLNTANRSQGGLDFWTRAYSWRWLLGECFIIIERGNPFAPAMPNAMWAVSGRYLRVVPGEDGEYIKAYRFIPPGKGESNAVEIDPLDVVPLISFNPAEPLRGLSPLVSLRLGLDSEAEAKSTNRDMFRNGAMADVVISPAGDVQLTQAQREHMDRSLADRFTGGGKAHRPLFLPGGVRVDAVRLTPRDAEFIELDKLTTRDVAKAYKIPPMFLGMMDDATFSNYETAWRALHRLAIFPVVRSAGATLTMTLAPQFGDNVAVRPDEDFMRELLQDEKAIADTMGVLVRSGYDRLGVARMMLGDHVDEGFVSNLVPTTLQPPKAAVSPPPTTDRRLRTRAAGDTVRDKAEATRGELEPAATEDVRGGMADQLARVLKAWRSDGPTRTARRDVADDYAAVVFPDWADDPLTAVVADVIGNGIARGAADTTELFDLAVDEGRLRDEGLEWARTAAAEEVRYINDTTRGFLRGAIADGLAAGETPKQIEARIREAFSQSGEADEAARYRNRPRAIAETEIGTAYNHGSNAAIEAANEDKVWLWSGNRQDTRHEGMDGQRRKPGEAFNVRGNAGQYPGDPALPAGERIHCKCSEGVALEGDDDA